MSATLNGALIRGKVVVKRGDFVSGEVQLVVPGHKAVHIGDGLTDLTKMFTVEEIKRSNLKTLVTAGRVDVWRGQTG